MDKQHREIAVSIAWPTIGFVLELMYISAVVPSSSRLDGRALEEGARRG